MEHIHNTTAENAGHLVRVQSCRVIPETTLGTTNGVATIFSKEDRNREVGEELDLDVITGLSEAALATPGVDVVTPEVNSALLLTAVEVLSHVGTDFSIVVRGVSNTHPSATVLLLVSNVRLHISSGSLGVGRSVGYNQLG